MMRTPTLSLICLVLLLSVCHPAMAKKEKKGPKITNKVYFDITIGGKEAGLQRHCSPLLSASPLCDDSLMASVPFSPACD